MKENKPPKTPAKAGYMSLVSLRNGRTPAHLPRVQWPGTEVTNSSRWMQAGLLTSTPLDPVFSLCLGCGQPLHILQLICPALREGHNVIYHKAGTWARSRARRWAWMRILERAACGRIPGDAATRISQAG